MNHWKKWAGGVVIAAMAGPGFAQNKLVNGNFDAYVGGFNSGPNYQTVNAGESAILGWTVGGRSVDLILAPNYGGISGVSVDLAGTPGPGELSQSFTSVIGQFYRLDFDYFRNGTPVGALNVSFGDAVLTYQPDSLATFGMATYYFQATQTSTLLSFASVGNGNSGPVIDNVSVTAVPEPETYGLALAAVGIVGGMSRFGKRRQA